MFKLRLGRGPAVSVSTRWVPLSFPAILLLAAAAGGCSSTSGPQAVSWSTTPNSQPYTANEPPRRRYDVEGDGMEAQVAPPRSIREAPDDPSEPFSPNYGQRPSDRARVAPPTSPHPVEPRPTPAKLASNAPARS